jgi:dolichol kinase
MRYEGTNCPHCDSDEITATSGPEAISAITIVQAVACNICEATWQEWYTLKGQDNLTLPV